MLYILQMNYKDLIASFIILCAYLFLNKSKMNSLRNILSKSILINLSTAHLAQNQYL